MQGLSSAQLSELIASIYDRAIDPDWGETLGRMRRALGGENAALSLIDLRTNQFFLNFFDNVPSELQAGMSRWQDQIVDLWGGRQFVLDLPLDEPAILSQVTRQTRQGPSDSRDTYAAAGFADAMCIGLARDNEVIGSCVFGRARADGRFREDEIALARLLAPHAQRALAFSRMFQLAALRADAFEAALEGAGVPTLLVTDRSELVHANSAAQAELERGDALRMAGLRVTGGSPSTDRDLSQALAAARERPDANPDNLNVRLDAKGRQLKLLPLPRNSQRGLLAPGAAAAIVMTGRSRPDRPDDEALANRLVARHGLTRSEAAVAVEIAKGDGRAAAAARLGIRENTVRTHLSAVFDKLAINRQAQLVRLIEGQVGDD